MQRDIVRTRTAAQYLCHPDSQIVTAHINGYMEGAIEALQTLRMELYHMPFQHSLTAEQVRMVEHIDAFLAQLEAEKAAQDV